MTTIKTFRAPTLEAAKKLASTELGADYVVVATRRVDKPSVFGLFSSSEIELSVTRAARPPEERSGAPFAALLRAAGPGAESELESIRAEVRAEVRTLRALFARQQAREPEAVKPGVMRDLEAEILELTDAITELRSERDKDIPAQLRRALAAAGIEANAQRLIAKKVRERGDGAALMESYRAVLLELVPTCAFPVVSDERVLLTLVGPTGAGKTTTAAKLAAHAIHDLGRTVTLVSTDAYRVGAVEQLERFATLMGAELRVARTRHALEEAIELAKTDVVIVDTAGRPGAAGDEFVTKLDRTRLAATWTQTTLLSVPAAIREVDARSVARSFAPFGPTALNVTKLDETTAKGGLVHASLATKLPIAALCFGQRVPEDIAPANPLAILNALVPPARRARTAADKS